MKRKSPYKHSVIPHVRSGGKVRRYERGKGGKPKAQSSNILGKRGVNYRVQVFYPSGSETHNIGGTTYVGALKSGLSHLQAEGAPYRVHLRRGN